MSNLGIIAVSPSPDPASAVVNSAIAAINVLKRLIGRGRREADILTGPQGAQTILADALDQLDAAWSRTADADRRALLTIRQEQKRLADEFENFTYSFPLAGPGARATILGIQQRDGTWRPGSPPAEGWLTRQADRFDRRLQVIGTVIQSDRWQNGFMDTRGGGGYDVPWWERIFNIGEDIADRVLPRGGRPTEPYWVIGPDGRRVLVDPTVGGGEDVYQRPPGAGGVPDWFFPVLVGGAVLLGGSLLLKRK